MKAVVSRGPSLTLVNTVNQSNSYRHQLRSSQFIKFSFVYLLVLNIRVALMRFNCSTINNVECFTDVQLVNLRSFGNGPPCASGRSVGTLKFNCQMAGLFCFPAILVAFVKRAFTITIIILGETSRLFHLKMQE